jgi:ABC-type multidrug transport system ATPase subunit
MTPMTPDIPAIEVNGLGRRFGRTDAVDGLNLRVRTGCCYGFFGRNGAGKTTTIKCLLNLIRPTSGRARVFGVDPRQNEVLVKSRLSYVPDYVAFYAWMTVRSSKLQAPSSPSLLLLPFYPRLLVEGLIPAVGSKI